MKNMKTVAILGVQFFNLSSPRIEVETPNILEVYTSLEDAIDSMDEEIESTIHEILFFGDTILYTDACIDTAYNNIWFGIKYKTQYGQIFLHRYFISVNDMILK